VGFLFFGVKSSQREIAVAFAEPLTQTQTPKFPFTASASQVAILIRFEL